VNGLLRKALSSKTPDIVMLAHEELKAFVPTVNPGEAKTFYKDVLGLELLSEDGYALEFRTSNALLRVTLVPELKPHGFTVLGWNVRDIVSTIGVLNKKGVVFEKYSFLRQDNLGIWTSPNGSKVAWFRDPDGNVLSITE
jgi:catechol 2,3-dioxygenase-like lactoylglutathione lyase family enzyme